jgi:hypothetical protein
MNQATNARVHSKAHSKALRAVAKLTQIDLVAAVKSKRHNPILDAEIHIEEELINLQESVASLAAAGDTVHKYPKMYSYISREKRAIMKHCIGLVARMICGKSLPRPYTKADIDEALRKLVQLIVLEMRRTGRQIDDDVMQLLRPFLTVRQRVVLRDFGMDMVMQASQLRRAASIATRLQQLSFRSR